MSILKTNNIEHLDASTPAIQVAVGGGVNISGVTTVGDNLTIDGVNRNITTGVGQTVGFGTDISIGGNLKSNGNSFVFPSSGGTLDRLERAGNILQVVQTVKSDADSYALVSGGLSANIIEKSITVSAGSKVLIMCSMVMMATTPSYGFVFNRDGTSIGIADADGSRFRATAIGYSDPDRQDSTQCVTAMFLDTPGSAGTYTYAVKIRHMSSITQTVYVNLFENDSNQSKLMRPISHFTLMEVAG
jgi:hypothetical protein